MIKKIINSFLLTIAVFFLSSFIVNGTISLIAKKLSVESSNTWAILAVCTGIIFSIFICTFTILDAIKNLNKIKKN